MKKFPQTIYIRHSIDGEYFVAEENAAKMVDNGETAQVAMYRLLDIKTYRGVVEEVPPPPRKRKAKEQ